METSGRADKYNHVYLQIGKTWKAQQASTIQQNSRVYS